MRPRYISLDPLLPWTQMPRPLPLGPLFGRSTPTEVEIGFGSGDYLVKLALEHPGKNFVGIETGWLSIKHALRKLALSGVRNVRLLQGDARVLFKRLFEQKSIGAVYSLFPCPWPKKRHIKHRLFDQPFLRLLNSRLGDGGTVLIVTDHEDYYHWVLEQTEGSGFAVDTELCPPRYFTKYEKKWLDLGQSRFFQITMRKTTHMSIPVEEDITLKTYCIPRFVPEFFHPKGCRDGVVVEFKETLYDPLRQKAMVRALVVEGNYIQNFWVEIAKEEKCWRIRLAKGCGVVPTAGVQRALDLIYQSAQATNA